MGKRFEGAPASLGPLRHYPAFSITRAEDNHVSTKEIEEESIFARRERIQQKRLDKIKSKGFFRGAKVWYWERVWIIDGVWTSDSYAHFDLSLIRKTSKGRVVEIRGVKPKDVKVIH